MKKLLILIPLMIFALFISRSAEAPILVAENDTAKAPEIVDITLIAVGDNLLHQTVSNSGKQADGSYDYHHIYENLQPIISDADIAVIGQETILGGIEMGISGYPLFNSPQEVGVTIEKEGFDVVLHASNHVLDMGYKGVKNTLDFWNSHPNVTVLGINESEEKQQEISIIERKGVKFALLNYTYGTNGIPLPSDKPYLVNLIDKNKMERDIIKAKEISDCIVVFMHWGTEYSYTANSEQKDLSQFMSDLGVQLIIGSHPHVMEPVEWHTGRDGNKTLVYYSLGNFVSHQHDIENLIGGMAEVNFKCDGKKIWIDSAKLTPLITHISLSLDSFTVYPIKEYTDVLASKNALSKYNTNSDLYSIRKVVYDILSTVDAVKIDY